MVNQAKKYNKWSMFYDSILSLNNSSNFTGYSAKELEQEKPLRNIREKLVRKVKNADYHNIQPKL